MNSDEFIRKIRKIGRKNKKRVKIVSRRGKGSHVTLFYGDSFTIVQKTDNLKTGTLDAMLKQIGLTIKDFQ